MATLLEETRGECGALAQRELFAAAVRRPPPSSRSSPSLPLSTAAAHEDIERLERAIVRDYFSPARGHGERLAQAHRVRGMLDKLQAAAGRLRAIYADDNGARAAEVAALRGEGDGVGTFLDRLADLRAFHARFPDAEPGPGTEDPDAPIGADAAGGPPPPPTSSSAPPAFSGEEAGGRCLDLHAHHRAWVNNPAFGPAGEYTAYVRGLAAFGAVPRPARRSAAWRAYLSSLLSYLEGFYDRAHPLERLDRVYAGAGCGEEAEFAARFAAGRVPGWRDWGVGPLADDAPSGAAPALPAPGSDFDLDAFSSVVDLEALPPDTLRGALASRGLKAGGTPAQRAERLWLAKTTPLHALDRKHFAKGVAPPPPPPPAAGEEGGEAGGAAHKNACRSSAWMEARVAALVDPASGSLAPEVAATATAVEQKQARTYEEAAADAEEAAAGGGADALPSDSEGEDEYVYNPKDLPLGWDGKPIPFWLFKLHGLNRSFPCEICGGFVYRGRREFERHFREARHAAGMRALGIPNTKEFLDVTAIEDARSLWATIRGRVGGAGGGGGGPPGAGGAAVAAATAGIDEEVEDADGNVYTRKTYEDLKRQGLL